PRNHAPKVGEVFRNPQLAWTCRQIAEHGRDAFYTGEIAKRIVASAASHGGTMTLADLAAFPAEWVDPMATAYRGWTVYALPPTVCWHRRSAWPVLKRLPSRSSIERAIWCR